MWPIKSHEDVKRRLKKFQKKWPHEMKNILDNLDTLQDALRRGAKAEQLKHLGFVHSEPSGVLAIDQKGPGKGTRMKQFRLYVFPDEGSKVLHVRTLGDKDTQTDDIALTTQFVQQLLQKESREKPKGEV